MSNYAIYQPKNKAAEYASWACNFYVGCSNGCTYCYCKKGILAPVMGMDKPQLKSCFWDEDHAMMIFGKEILKNHDRLKAEGLFFSFTTDPCLPETWPLTWNAVLMATSMSIPVKILTKCTKWIETDLFKTLLGNKELIAIGFTLTGHDELEPNASTNAERIEAMKKLHDAGFKTFASIEPIIDLVSSLEMIKESVAYCELFKIGVESGKKYDKLMLRRFVSDVICTKTNNHVPKLYFKDSLLKAAGIERSELPDNCVTRDYNIFKSE